MRCSSQTTASGTMLEVCSELEEMWPKVLLEGINNNVLLERLAVKAAVIGLATRGYRTVMFTLNS